MGKEPDGQKDNPEIKKRKNFKRWQVAVLAVVQCCYLGNPMDRGAWQATQSMGLQKSRTWLSDWANMHAYQLYLNKIRRKYCIEKIDQISNFPFKKIALKCLKYSLFVSYQINENYTHWGCLFLPWILWLPLVCNRCLVDRTWCQVALWSLWVPHPSCEKEFPRKRVWQCS